MSAQLRKSYSLQNFGKRAPVERRIGFAVLPLLLMFHAVQAQQPPAGESKVEGSAFLRAIAALDEPRGLCVDIPGHRARVNVKAALVVHTCKWNIWNLDERFDAQALARGDLRMPAYDLCLGVEAAREGAEIRLGNCDGAVLRRWTMVDQRLRLTAAMDMCLTVGPEPSELTPGGRRLPSRHVARSLTLAACAAAASERQLWRFVAPDR